MTRVLIEQRCDDLLRIFEPLALQHLDAGIEQSL